MKLKNRSQRFLRYVIIAPIVITLVGILFFCGVPVKELISDKVEMIDTRFNRLIPDFYEKKDDL